MGAAESPQGSPSLPRKVIRTVTPAPRGHRDAEMNTIGWSMFLGLLILLVPLLPFLVIGFAVVKLLDALAGRRSDEPSE